MNTNFEITPKTKADIFEISEGVPGAMIVIMEMTCVVSKDQFLENLSAMKDMNISGTQVWIAFHDYAKKDVEVFSKAIAERNPEMIDCVNQNCPDRVASVGTV